MNVMPAAGLEVGVYGGVVELPHHGPKLQGGAGGEDDDGGDEAGEVFSQDQDFAAHGSEEVVVQAFVEHLAAEEVHEDADAAEEDRQAQIEVLEDGGEDEGVLREGFGSSWKMSVTSRSVTM